MKGAHRNEKTDIGLLALVMGAAARVEQPEPVETETPSASPAQTLRPAPAGSHLLPVPERPLEAGDFNVYFKGKNLISFAEINGSEEFDAAPKDASFETMRGIRIGSAFEEVLDAYGDIAMDSCLNVNRDKAMEKLGRRNVTLRELMDDPELQEKPLDQESSIKVNFAGIVSGGEFEPEPGVGIYEPTDVLTHPEGIKEDVWAKKYPNVTKRCDLEIWLDDGAVWWININVSKWVS